MKRLNYLKVLREPVYTKLSLVKDLDKGEYFVEKSLIVEIDFQKTLFENEVNVHASLNNRYIITFIEQLEAYKFLMEYASAGNLMEVIHAGTDEKLKIKYCIQFLTGLAYLHEQGFAHNDIKPSNILINRDNRAKLSDFAFCGKLGEVTFKDIPSAFILGTDFFRRPGMESSFSNQISNDLYAVGKVLYLLFSGSRDYKRIDLANIENPTIRDIVESCLNGTISSLEPILKILTRR